MKKKVMIGIMKETGMAVYRLPSGKIWVSRRCVSMRYPPEFQKPKRKIDRAVAT